MNKSLIITLCFSFFLVAGNRSIQAQTEEPRTPDSKGAVSIVSDQGELRGPVRRVRVETAQILVKNGNLVEGPRVLRGIATYDQKGVKIDSVSYLVDDTTRRGKQQSSYDDKGNITELVLLGDDGSMLSKKVYKYEHDELGNWKKMTSAIAVYENGALTYEPIEVTYRTITYYYEQTIQKFASAASKAHTVGGFSPTDSISPAPVSTTGSSENITPAKLKIVPGNEGGSSSVGSKVTNAESKDSSAIASKEQEDVAVTKSSTGLGIKTEAPTSAVPATNEISLSRDSLLKHVSEKVLRAAAINLPMPEYPQEASHERFPAKVVVQVVVNEKGEVGSARAISGNSQLHHAAERAARNARFLPAKLSSDPTKVFGVISYDFTIPVSNTASVPASTTSLEVSSSTPPVEDKVTKVNEPSAVMVTTPAPALSADKPANSLAPANPSFYETGLGYLTAGRYVEAVAAFKQSIKVNPNDAIAYVRLGMAHSALHQYAEAVFVLNRAIEMKREAVDSAGYFHLGHAYVSLNQPSDAIKAFRQGLYTMRAEAASGNENTFIKFEDLHYNLGVAYNNASRFNDAIKQFKEVVKLNPKLAEGYYGLGVAYLAVHDTKSAQSQATLLKSLNPALANKLKGAIDAATHDSRLVPNRNRVF